jgi:aminoglycoside 3-N-acetyltransferase
LSASEAAAAPDAAVRTALERLGIPRDGVLMVHSAFKAFKREGFAPAGVLAALREHMKDGTLLLPTMSWRFVKPANPVFDELATPSNTGALTEIFRTQIATHRSLHPTHSVAGVGPRAEAMLSGHHLDDTPCALRSPFGELVPHDAHVMMMGITMDCCTLVHHVEEMIAPELYLKPVAERETYTCKARGGKEHTVLLRRHLFLPRDYWQFQDELASQGKFRVTTIGSTVCRAFRARDMHEAVTRALTARPDAIIARPGQRYRMM